MTTILIDENCREGKAFIELLRQMKFARVLDNNNEWWATISQAERDAIEEGLTEIDKGETISHEAMQQQYEKWL